MTPLSFSLRLMLAMERAGARFGACCGKRGLVSGCPFCEQRWPGGGRGGDQ